MGPLLGGRQTCGYKYPADALVSAPGPPGPLPDPAGGKVIYYFPTLLVHLPRSIPITLSRRWPLFRVLFRWRASCPQAADAWAVIPAGASA